MGYIAVARNRVQCVTEHFDPDGVGPPARLRIGSYDVVYFRQSVPDPILALFRDSQWTRVQTDVNLLDEPIYSYALESPAEQIRARLALYGINGDTFRAALGSCQAGIEGFGPQPGLQSRGTYLQRLTAVDSFEYLAPLVSARVEWNLTDMYAAMSARPVAEDMLAALHHLDPLLIIYACVTVAPTATAVLDLTDLVSADGVEQWWIRPDDRDLCAAAVTRLSGIAMMPPIRVLTEGPTDERFIEAAFGILRPDVADLMTFLNPRGERNVAWDGQAVRRQRRGRTLSRSRRPTVVVEQCHTGCSTRAAANRSTASAEAFLGLARGLRKVIRSATSGRTICLR